MARKLPQLSGHAPPSARIRSSTRARIRPSSPENHPTRRRGHRRAPSHQPPDHRRACDAMRRWSPPQSLIRSGNS